MDGPGLVLLANVTFGEGLDKFFEWVAIPIVLVLPFILALAVVFRRPASRQERFQTVAALLLGLVVAAAVIMFDRGGDIPRLTWLAGGTSAFVLFGAGLVVSMVLLLFADKFALDLVMRIYVGLLAAATWIAVYSYFSNEEYRESMKYIAVGVLVGGLLYFMIFSSALEAFFTRKSSRDGLDQNPYQKF